MMRYGYICHKCKIEKEEFHGIKESPRIICDKCGEEMAKKFYPPRTRFVGDWTSSKTRIKIGKDLELRYQPGWEKIKHTPQKI